jgi:hypothetical protein
LLEKSLALRRKSLGERHPETIRSLIALADLTAASGKKEQAAAMYKSAAAQFKAVLGESHPLYKQTVDKLDKLK